MYNAGFSYTRILNIPQTHCKHNISILLFYHKTTRVEQSTSVNISCSNTKQQSLADAKISMQQQCVNAGP